MVAVTLGGRLESMKLLGTDVGWASTAHQLFWTTDGARTWKDITPKVEGENSMTFVFFLDTATGWVLLSRYDEPEPRFDLASTTNGGKTWTVSHGVIPNLDPRVTTLTTHGSLYFLDSFHGWMNIPVVSSSSAHLGVLLVTQDGGKTWDWAPGGTLTAGTTRFISQKDGWVLSPEQDALYETHDGAKSWRKPVLQATPSAVSESVYKYDLPSFADSKNGFLLASFPNSPWMLFTTSDGGRNWQQKEPIPELDANYTFLGPAAGGPAYIATVISKSIATNTFPLDGDAKPAAHVSADIRNFANFSTVSGVSFADTRHGWVLVSASKCASFMTGCTQLLATADGGRTWSNSTPPDVQGASSHRSPVGLRSMASNYNQPVSKLNAPYVATAAPAHLAFDSSNVLCTPSNCSTQKSVTYMQDWWNHSPYWDVGVYLLNAHNRHNDPNMTLAWITGVLQQGWGFIPTWFGDQAPCACTNPPNLPCAPFTYTIPGNPSNNYAAAYNDGVNEASNALIQAAAIGLPTGIIYKDIENYAPDGGTCSLSVQRYLSGWVTQMHSSVGSGSAGVYGNPLPAAQDFYNTSPMPDDIWIAKYDNRVTIWGLGQVSDQWWTNKQRMHQYQENVSGTFGGFQYIVDPEADFAAVLANNVAKTAYTWNFHRNSQCQPFGINDNGQFVGFADDEIDACLYSNGAYTFFAPPGNAAAIGNAINNKGQMVGYWYDKSNLAHGFFYDPNNPPIISFDYPGATCTYATGINDDGLIVGFWMKMSYAYCYDGPTITAEGGFLYNGITFTPINFPGQTCTYLTGINGDDQIAGVYSDCGDFLSGNGFLYSNGVYTDLGAEIENAWGINNNGQITSYTLSGSPGFYNANLGPGSFFNFSDSYAFSIGGIDGAADIVGTDGNGYLWATTQ